MTAESLKKFVNCQTSTATRLRLFCLPNAGSGVSILHSWMRGLPPLLLACPIQLPGRENRRFESPFRRMAPLVVELADALEPHLDLPFALFGHSCGALVAFELARELRRRRARCPVHLVLSARSAPQIHNNNPAISGLPEREFLAEIQIRYNAIPDAVLADSDLMSMYLPVLRADLEILETYVYTPESPLACSISVFGGLLDRTVGTAELEAWRFQTAGAFNTRMFSGGHFFPREVKQQFVDAISDELTPFARPR